MTLKHNKPNILSFFNMRRVNFACPHFNYTTISLARNAKEINEAMFIKWIEENLNGRYYLEKNISILNNSFNYNINLGFESYSELSIFTIACPYLNM